MSTPPAPQPEEPSASGTNRSGDDVPLDPEHSEAALRPSDLTGGPGQQEGPAQADDDEDNDDEYEPL